MMIEPLTMQVHKERYGFERINVLIEVYCNMLTAGCSCVVSHSYGVTQRACPFV
jgi:hypothetical protein